MRNRLAILGKIHLILGLYMVVLVGTVGWQPQKLQAGGESPLVFLPLVVVPPPTPTLDPILLSCDSNAWTLTWNAQSSLTTTYTVEEAFDADFAAPATYTTTETSLAFDYAPSPNNLFYYRVRAEGTFGSGPWSNTQSVLGGFLDDFSDVNSGWAEDEGSAGAVGYVDQAYRVQAKQAGFLVTAMAPDSPRSSYKAAVAARWADGSATDGIYGLVFGGAADLSQYYFLAVRGQEFRLYYFDSTLPTSERLRGLNGWTPAGVINTGTTPNQLQVKRVGDDIAVTINGSELGSWPDSAMTGATYAGVLAAANPNHPLAEARFDNFALRFCDGSQIQAYADALIRPWIPGSWYSGFVNLEW